MKTLFRLLIAGILLLGTSCEKEPFLDYELPNLGNTLEFTAEGGCFEVEISADCDYEIRCKDYWVTAKRTDNGINVSTQANLETLERESEIYILYYYRKEQICKTIKVKQEAFEPILAIENTEFEFDSNGGSEVIEIVTNAEYSVFVDVTWIKCSKKGNNLEITVSSSKTPEKRYGEITISLPKYDINEVVQIAQSACEPKIEISTTSLTFDYTGGEKTVNISSNFEYDIVCSTEWLTFKKVTEGVKFIASSNYVMTPRSIVVVIRSAKYGIEKRINVTQSTMPSDYTVIEYTTDFGGIVKPYDTKAFGDAQIVSNTYENGKGVLKFDIPITTIGYQAFYNSLLTSVTIPASVTSIGKDAFYGCSRLTSVHITNLSSWCKIDFTNSGANPLSYANAKLYLNGALVESLTIPSDITKIKQYAFCDCTSLQSVTITNSVTSIEKYAFYKCNQLESVVIPNSVRTIGEYAFTQCSLLSSIVIPNSVTEIKESTFEQCGLTDIKIGNQVKYIRYRAFYGHK